MCAGYEAKCSHALHSCTVTKEHHQLTTRCIVRGKGLGEGLASCPFRMGSGVFTSLPLLHIDLMQLTSSPHVNKRETDSRRKSGY